MNAPTSAATLARPARSAMLCVAMLIKKAQTLGPSENFVARHFAVAPVGCARHWKQFTEAPDRLELQERDEARVSEAARAAFQRFDVLLKKVFALPA